MRVKLFGSAARNNMDESSDIDLLFVLADGLEQEAVNERINDLAARTELWVGNDVRPLVYLASEVLPARIFDSILRDGIDVYGDPTWLRRRNHGWASHWTAPRAANVRTDAAGAAVRADRLSKAQQFLQVADEARPLADEGSISAAAETLYVHASNAAADAICAAAL